jgi:hypothetical protein
VDTGQLAVCAVLDDSVAVKLAASRSFTLFVDSSRILFICDPAPLLVADGQLWYYDVWAG